MKGERETGAASHQQNLSGCAAAGGRRFESRRQEGKFQADERRSCSANTYTYLSGTVGPPGLPYTGPINASQDASAAFGPLVLIGRSSRSTSRGCSSAHALAGGPKAPAGRGGPRGTLCFIIDAARMHHVYLRARFWCQRAKMTAALDLSLPLIGCWLTGEQIKASAGDFGAVNRHHRAERILQTTDCGDSLPSS